MFSYFISVFYAVLQLIVLIGIGYFLRKKEIFPQSFFKQMGIFLVKLVMPIYLFTKIATTERSILTTSIIFPFSTVIIIAIGIALGVLLFSFSPFHRTEGRAGIALSGFGNAAFIPLSIAEIIPITTPIIAEHFGTNLPSLYIGACVLVSSPLLWGVGNYLITGKGRKVKVTDIINPPFVGIVLGFLAAYFNFRTVAMDKTMVVHYVYRAFTNIGSTAVPLIMLTVGAMIANLKVHSKNFGPLLHMGLRVVGVRLFIVPLLFYVSYFTFLRHLPLNPAQYWVLFLETHIPPATNLSVMAVQAGVNEDYTSFSILITYLGYLVLFPFYQIFFINLPGVFPG